jgi:ribosomal protein L31
MTRILIEVTQKDINSGCRRNTMRCPVAKALKRYVRVPLVGSSHIFFNTENTRQIMDTPRSVMRFIKKFDANKPVKPFKFYLRLQD